MSLTGVKDVDMEIILQLDDRELPRVCAVNKYVNEICQSDAFWYKRLINRITKVRDDNFSKYKEIKMISVTGEKIREMQRFYGLKSLKELNNFLNELPPNAAYLAYHGFPYIDKQIKDTYKSFNEDELPTYINRDELRYEIRRHVVKSNYSPVGKELDNSTFEFRLVPTRQGLREDHYNAYKIMGIIK